MVKTLSQIISMFFSFEILPRIHKNYAVDQNGSTNPRLESLDLDRKISENIHIHFFLNIILKIFELLLYYDRVCVEMVFLCEKPSEIKFDVL